MAAIGPIDIDALGEASMMSRRLFRATRSVADT
jgi:hypothetical protein